MTQEERDDEAPQEGPDLATDYAHKPSWFEGEVVEVFADTLNININPYGMSITFGLRRPDGEPAPKARVFMCQQMGDAPARLLRRLLLTFERDNDVKIQVAPQVLEGLGITDDDLQALVAEVTQNG